MNPVNLTPMILPILTGGLGNRIFQVFAALGYAERYGGEVFFFELLWKENPHSTKESIFELFPRIKTLPKSFFCYSPQIITDSIFPPAKPSNSVIVLKGYFQDERWFPSTIPITLSQTMSLQTIPYSSCAFLHIRRGDYLILKHHYVPLEKYYKKALEKIPVDTPIVVFSDDMEWCKREWLAEPQGPSPPRKFIWAPEYLSDIETLSLMATCTKAAICANSSFSWLGAFLGAHQYGNPCYFPSEWFSDGRKTNIYPSWGEIISVHDESSEDKSSNDESSQ